MFKIELTGNLGGDAEVKSDNGRQYVQFSVADTKRFQDKSGNQVEETNWITCFLRNAESPVIPYLKKGTKVFVRGNAELRLFSSAKDRAMKAGASINVSEIELIGGASADEVPRELALPNGQLLEVEKFYWVDITRMADKPTTLYSKRGNGYAVAANGLVTPLPIGELAPQQQQTQAQPQQTQAQPQQTQAQPTGKSFDNEPTETQLPF